MGHATSKMDDELRMFLGRSASMPNAAFASAQGARASQEDRAYIHGSFVLGHWCLMMVLDGHAGTRVADFVLKAFPSLLKARIQALWPSSPADGDAGASLPADPSALEDPYEPNPHDLAQCIKSAMMYLDDELRLEYPHTPSGACAVVALVTDSHYIVAHVGDCRAIILQERSESDETGPGLGAFKSHTLTRDHEPRRPDEKARILASGHLVLNGRIAKEPYMGDINVSRAFGDFEYKDGPDPEAYAVTCIPEVAIWQVRSTDVALVLVSDGLLKLYGIDAANDGPIMRSIGQCISTGILDPLTLAMTGIIDAHHSRSTDNMTVAIFVDPHRGPVNPALEDEYRRVVAIRINEAMSRKVDHRMIDCK